MTSLNKRHHAPLTAVNSAQRIDALFLERPASVLALAKARAGSVVSVWESFERVAAGGAHGTEVVEADLGVEALLAVWVQTSCWPLSGGADGMDFGARLRALEAC